MSSLVLCVYGRPGLEVLKYCNEKLRLSQIAVFTHDLAGGREIISYCKEHQIWCATESINKSELPFDAPYLASVYYRNIIKKHVLDKFRASFNAHPSLLPRHRGCSSVPWAIIEGDSHTAVSFHYIEPGVDTGRIIYQSAFAIESDETQISLYKKCEDRVIECWSAAFTLVQSGFPGVEQIGEVSYHPRGCPFEGEIDPKWSDTQVERFIRAMYYPPMPGAKYKGIEINSLEQYKLIRKMEHAF